MSISLVQRKSAHSLSGTSVSATFASNIAAGNGLLAAVLWIDSNSNTTPYPVITVADSFGSWQVLREIGVTLGGDVKVSVFFIPYCKAGPNGAVTATATAPGMMFLSLHEVAPNTGEIFKFDDSGVNSGLGYSGTFSDLTNNVICNAPQTYNRTEYYFAAFGTRTGNIDPTNGLGMTFTQREYEVNASGAGAMSVLGSLATLDGIGNQYGVQPNFSPVWSYSSSIVACVLVCIASLVPVADPPTASPVGGEFTAAPAVTLTQDQGLAIRYTTDGTTPTGASTLYTGPITITGPTMTLKAIGTQPATGYPGGFWTDSTVATWVYDIFTGTCVNAANIIDGDDTTFSLLTSNGATGDVVGVKANLMNGITGAPALIKVDFEVTQNDLVAPSQTLPAWKVSGFIAGVETVLASGAVGAGVVARNIVTLAVSAGVHANTLAAKIFATCQIPGSTGGVKVKVYGAYLVD